MQAAHSFLTGLFGLIFGVLRTAIVILMFDVGRARRDNGAAETLAIAYVRA